MISGFELPRLDRAVTAVRRTFSQQVDKLVLQSLNRRIPNSLEQNLVKGITLDGVLAQTSVDPPEPTCPR